MFSELQRPPQSSDLNPTKHLWDEVEIHSLNGQMEKICINYVKQSCPRRAESRTREEFTLCGVSTKVHIFPSLIKLTSVLFQRHTFIPTLFIFLSEFTFYCSLHLLNDLEKSVG